MTPVIKPLTTLNITHLSVENVEKVRNGIAKSNINYNIQPLREILHINKDYSRCVRPSVQSRCERLNGI